MFPGDPQGGPIQKSAFFFYNNLESKNSGLGNTSGPEEVDIKEHILDILPTSAGSPHKFPFGQILARGAQSRVSLRDPKFFRRLLIASAKVHYGSNISRITDGTNGPQHGRSPPAAHTGKGASDPGQADSDEEGFLVINIK